MINHIILRLLKENGFNRYFEIKNELTESAIFTYRENDIKSEFYLIIYMEEDVFLKVDENKLFSSLSKSINQSEAYTAEVDKNTSLIICVKRDSNIKVHEHLEKKELKVEENPYFFKKYVLSYNENIAQKVFGKVFNSSSSNLRLTEFVESTITNHENFIKFKSNEENYEEYELLAKIVIKVPVVKIKNPDIKSIKSINQTIHEKISADNLEKAKKLVEFINEKDIVDNQVVKEVIDFWVKGCLNEGV